MKARSTLMFAVTLSLSAAVTALVVAACGTAAAEGEGEGEGEQTQAQQAQTPPEGDANLQTWLAQGFYKNWTCESAPHDARSPSPHGRNRICSNDTLALAQQAPWPVGSAAVKELFDDNDNQVGVAVYRKTAEGTDGSNWYWYEKTDGDGLVADGHGDTGVPLTVCVDCHSHANDFVFTQVGAGGCGGG